MSYLRLGVDALQLHGVVVAVGAVDGVVDRSEGSAPQQLDDGPVGGVRRPGLELDQLHLGEGLRLECGGWCVMVWGGRDGGGVAGR